MKKILITGGAGRFANHIKDICKGNKNYKLLLPIKSEMDFRSLDNCEKYFEEHKNDFDYVIHSGGLSSPMIRHKKYPTLSIQTNIIGTSNTDGTIHFTVKPNSNDSVAFRSNLLDINSSLIEVTGATDTIASGDTSAGVGYTSSSSYS